MNSVNRNVNIPDGFVKIKCSRCSNQVQKILYSSAVSTPIELVHRVLESSAASILIQYSLIVLVIPQMTNWRANNI